ncbi:MAG TPA: SiaC family regulatory phosphoprotein, partial [Bacteroidia bacterium]|nr:SiaC family regulatory phosphoprotein [Bacteroidia bacterium]
RPVEDFIEALDPEHVKNFSFTFRLEYMNTLSSKAFLDYMRIVKDLKQIPLSVTWEYYSDDEEMRDHGETFSEIVDIPFNYSAIDPSKRVQGRK